jgi:hypothetical protein
MKTLNTRLALSAFNIVVMLTSPASAQKPHRQPSHHRMMSDPAGQSGLGLYDMVPSPYDPAVTGAGSLGYNQNLHDNNW